VIFTNIQKIPVIRKYKDFTQKESSGIHLAEKSASTHSLTAGNVENAPCGQIKKKKLLILFFSYCDNMVGIKQQISSILSEL